jgi:glycosyltransferase involved in cell wall biosynthesis
MNALGPPRVSVVMPVHNGLPYLDESIASILGQSLEDFEFVILDAGSTDGTGAALREWRRKDGRLRVTGKRTTTSCPSGPIVSCRCLGAGTRFPPTTSADPPRFPVA